MDTPWVFHSAQLLLELLELYQFHWRDLCYYSSFHPPPPWTEAIITEFFVYHLLSFAHGFVTEAYIPKQHIFNFTWLFIPYKNGKSTSAKSVSNGIENGKISKLLEENTEQYLYDFQLRRDVLNKT